MSDFLEHDPGPHEGPDTDQEPPWKVLTREEALVLRAKNPVVSPWRIVAAQAVAGLLCALVVAAVTQRQATTWSALYGAAVVVLPGALLARGMSRGAGSPAAAAASFMFWELVKIALAVAMLVAVAKGVPGLSWPALLVAMVVCMKLGWLALLWPRRRR
jgi:ATP synthase protein I